jgi:hypothetical protein
MFSDEEIYIRRSKTDFLNTNDTKWEFENPVPGVVIGMVGD